MNRLMVFDNIKYLKMILLTIFLVLIFPLVSAAEIIFMKNSSDFSQGETLLAKVSGNFIDQITPERVTFYRGSVKIPMDFNVVNLQDDFYIYAFLLGKNPGNYSFTINNVFYYKGSQIVNDELTQNFSINQNLSDFYVRPGAILTEKNFEVEVQNLKSTQIKIQIKNPADITPEISEKSFTLKSGEIKKINFVVSENAFGLYFIDLDSLVTSYSIPIFIEKKSTINLEQKQKFEFRPNEINFLMPTNSDSKRVFYLLNTGNSDIEKINLTLSNSLVPFIKIEPKEIQDLAKDKSKKIEISIESDSEQKVVEGKIFAVSENFSSELQVVINFVKDYTPTEEEKKEVVTTCSQLNGKICSQDQECTAELTQTKDGGCCVYPGVCEGVKKGSSGKLIGLIILIVVLLILFWLYNKYKKVKR